MIWLNAAALLALAVAAGPVLVHLLVQRRAEPLAFPTLRFLRPARLASVRRHVLDDLPLLAVRCAVLAAAVAALAGPLFVTASRRSAWDRRLTRAIVRDADGARSPVTTSETPFKAQEFPGPSLRDGVRRATAWLESAPPSRRELVIESRLTIGSIAAADFAAVPADVGIRFVRIAGLPPTRIVPLARLLTAGGLVDRDVTLAGAATIVRLGSTAPLTADAWPVEVVASPASRPAMDAAITAVTAERVVAPAPDRRARIVVVDGPIQQFTASTIRAPWIADAIGAMADDADLQAAARRIDRGVGDRRFAAEPWQPIARAADGAVLVAGTQAGDGRLVVASGAAPSDIATAILVRATANALAPRAELQRDEIVPIPDDDVRAWTRPAGPVSGDRLKNIDEDDRRWLWAATLLLLAVETWLRRARRSDAAHDGREAARVA